jgi:hypothetical protein
LAEDAAHPNRIHLGYTFIIYTFSIPGSPSVWESHHSADSDFSQRVVVALVSIRYMSHDELRSASHAHEKLFYHILILCIAGDKLDWDDSQSANKEQFRNSVDRYVEIL